jgi:hypothetical protein
LVCEVASDDDGWFVEAEDDWLAELEGWLVDAAGWFVEAEEAGELIEDDGWLVEADDDSADFAWSSAAWVLGPMTPSIGPGSKPLAFSACCVWRTDSSPAAFAGLLGAEASVDALAGAVASGEALVEADGAGAAGCAGCAWDCAEALGSAETDVEGWLFAASAEPAAIRAATSASFFISMRVILSSLDIRSAAHGKARGQVALRICKLDSVPARNIHSRAQWITARAARRQGRRKG